MVETAIVMPLMVFVILGLIQLGLLQQGRAMAKYAAYKAVRAGAIHSAKMDVMEKAALAVLLPVVGYEAGGGEVYNRTRDSGDLQTAWNRMRSNTHGGTSLKIAKITICQPTTATVGSGDSIDFDAPAMNPVGWDNMDKGKLSIQVTFHYRLVIPFANMVIWNITRADQIGEQLVQTVRLGAGQKEGLAKQFGTSEEVDAYGPQNKYFLPIRASFAMRMQSNFFPNKSGFELPSSSDCVLNFPKK